MIPSSESIIKQVHPLYIKKLKNLHTYNKKLLILFSGVPGSGKTFVAKKIEEEFKAIRINADTIRGIFRKSILPKYPQIKGNFNEIVIDYTFYLMDHIPQNNGLIIIDSSIDRKYKRVFKWAKNNGYKYFIIRLIIPRDTIIERIRLRDKEKAKYYFSHMNKWIEDNYNFNKNVRANFDFNNEADLGLLLGSIKKKLVGSSSD